MPALALSTISSIHRSSPGPIRSSEASLAVKSGAEEFLAAANSSTCHIPYSAGRGAVTGWFSDAYLVRLSCVNFDSQKIAASTRKTSAERLTQRRLDNGTCSRGAAGRLNINKLDRK